MGCLLCTQKSYCQLTMLQLDVVEPLLLPRRKQHKKMGGKKNYASEKIHRRTPGLWSLHFKSIPWDELVLDAAPGLYHLHMPCMASQMQRSVAYEIHRLQLGTNSLRRTIPLFLGKKKKKKLLHGFWDLFFQMLPCLEPFNVNLIIAVL